jgi:hypothetical protein
MLGLGVALPNKKFKAGFNPNSIDNMYFQGAGGQFIDNRFVSKATSQTGSDTRLLLDRSVNSLNGSTQNAIAPDNAAYDITDNLTVIVRAKNDNALLAADELLVSKYNTTGDEREWSIGISSTELLINQFGNGTGAFAGQQSSDSTVSDLNTARTYAFTFDGGVVQQSIDGSNVASTTTTGTLPPSLYNGVADLTIGSRTGAAFWDGDIYEVIILVGDSGVLTEAQIADIHASIQANPTKDVQDTVYGLTGQTVVSHLIDVGQSNMIDVSGAALDAAYQNSPTVATTTENSINYFNEFGYYDDSGTPVPIDFSDPTNAVDGNPLTYTGKALPYAYIEGNNCISLNGSTQEGVIGDIGNIDKVQGWFKLDADNQVLCSLANTAATQIHVTGSTLAVGGSLTLGAIEVDGISKTAAEAGALLNDNTWHYVTINITSFDATDFRAGRANAVYGDINVAGLQLSLTGVDVVNAPIAEGAGAISYDTSGNGNDVAWQNSPAWSTQDEYAYNITNGFSLYEHASSADIRVPYGADGSPLTITPPTGYSKTSDNPAVIGHNDAESTFDFINISDTGNAVPETAFMDSSFATVEFNEDWDSFNYAFYRPVSSVSNDRYTIYTEALVGANLERLLDYVNFTPLELAGLTFMGEADANGFTNGEVVTTFPDLSPNGHDLVRDETTTFTYDAVNKILNKTTNTSCFENLTDTLYGAAATVILFGKLESGRATAAGTIVSLVNTSAVAVVNDDTTIRYNAPSTIAGGTYDLTDSFMFALRIEDATTAKIRVNSEADTSFTPNGAYDNNSSIRVGALTGATAAPEGGIRAFYVFDRGLTDGELEKIVAYGVRRGFF